MIALMKMDFWLMRWFLPLVVVGPFITVPLFNMEYSMYGMLLVFIVGITLPQQDKQQNTKRFMLSLPIALKSFLPARALVMVSIGLLWIIFESIAVVIVGMSSSNPFFYISTQLTIMFVLAPILLAIINLIDQPVLKWGSVFISYMIIIFIGSIISLFGQELMNTFGNWGYLLAAAFVVVGALAFWLISTVTNAIRLRMDLL